MSRRKPLEYEVRVVVNAQAPAVARREPEDDPDGKVVVEVDENLRGEAREAAVHLALQPFQHGRLGVVPVPFFAVLWDAGARKLQEYPRAAAAVAGAGTAAAVGVAGLSYTGGLDAEQRRAPVLAVTTMTTVTQIIEPVPPIVTPSALSIRSRTPGRTPPPTRVAEPAFGGGARRTSEGPPPRPTAKAVRTTRPPSPQRTPTPARPAAIEEKVREESQPITDRPSPDRPTVEGQLDQPTPEPQPEPGPVVELEVSVGDCHLVELDVGVGDLLDAGVCL